MPCWRYRKNSKQMMSHPLSEELTREFMEKARTPLRDQEAIEAADEVDFDTFLAAYLTPQ